MISSEIPHLFCSKKLSDLILLKTNKSETIESNEKWNGHLFYIDKRKCLIFIHKQTLYSVVVIDILKKDLDNFNKFFTDNFIKQLYIDNILNIDNEEKIKEIYNRINLRTTDNDRRVTGFLNDGVFRMKSCIYDLGKSYIRNYRYNNLNITPMGSKKIIYPIEEMRKLILNYS
ncbi:hypothetical protein BH10BAC5_BH10BAC5_05480 [soil metagenome]